MIDEEVEDHPRPPIYQLRRPPAPTARWMPASWTGVPLLEDIQEIKSQESLEMI